MKNPNGKVSRLRAWFGARWSGPDVPNGEARFQITKFVKDFATFILLPTAAIIVFKACETAFVAKKRPQLQNSGYDSKRMDSNESQIIEFKPFSDSLKLGVGRHAPGTVVRVKLLNAVETYSTTPIHAQIIDGGLGQGLVGGTLIGDGTPDTNFNRINMTFHYALDPYRGGVAFPISARALSLDGTFGVIADKKESYFSRSVIGSGGSSAPNAQTSSGSNDLRDILFRALAAGFVQEYGNDSQVERNRSQVLTLEPSTEFLVELTDFFPGGGK